ncbi:response regulator [Massilia violaceinigra]|uniref:Response regulator n=1 Tax=Massilia violaceinigra TaxID=2045208 RepID=A0ABY3ZZN0_9BURK|nr:response regulator [Massilia violaceinigra]UOD27807.1 response regulator [Massilia violaceinigra]
MKVLVVDDDIVSRMVLMHLIDACGKFEILEAEDGADAWDQLENGLRPAICFCDLRMPRLSGMDLLQRVRADGALGAMPFVLVSSATDRDTVDQASGLGVSGYIVKPFQGDQVREHMAGLTGRDPIAVAPRAEQVQATLLRLGIGAERLMVYLGGLQSQVVAAAADIADLLERGEDGAAHVRIERLHAGCLTLGLNGAADTLKALPPGALDPARVKLALAEVVRSAMHQSEALKRIGGGA